MASTTTVSGLSDLEHSVQLRRAVVASTVGTAIEWYDFFLYGTVAALVFPKLYFPNEDPISGLLLSFTTYFIGFLARPVGAAIFGHYGDRIGRKATLIATLMLMGIATFLIAFVPSYQSIGIWGAVILTFLRFVQGVGVGGEWGGSVLLAMEWSRSPSSRGFIASWPQFGVPCGLLLSNLAFLAFSQLAGDQFITWGWRLPFVLSIILVGIGLYIRLGILETPIFSKLLAEKKIERQPMLQVIKRNWREIITSAFVRLAEQAPFYIFTAYVFSYGTGVLKVSRDFLLLGVMAASVLSFVSIPLSGHISDLIGRKKMYLLGAATVGIFGFIYFGLMNSGSMTLMFIAIFLSLVPHDMMYGPQAALIAESFTGRLRYSGASLGYQLASIIAGGPAPFVATWLFGMYGSGYAIAGYILVCAIITLIATTMMKDYTGKDIEGEYE
ncbi:MAG TPA: MFS transporter [Stellaceae bacterium]|nr:MFS transporter [Stellaceae bacterium]